MPSIPFPNIPAYPGVPALVRPVSVTIAQTPILAIGIGTVENVLGSALQQAPRWGIFDGSGNQLGLHTSASISRTQAILSALASQITGDAAPVLSTLSVDFVKETTISDFPIEKGSFASYNKVERPANPTVTLALAGTEGDRTNLLNAIDGAVKSTNLYNIITPEINYIDYALERYVYSRRAYRGATLIVIDISLKEIRQVSATFATSTTPIVQPQNAAATPQVNNGATQTVTPDTSTLRSIAAKLGIVP